MPANPLIDELDAHYQGMPPVAALRLAIAGHDADSLCLRAPLAANVNDKGCAFGGSLASLMTLAGWGLAWLRLREAGIDADLYVARSELRYLKPLYADLEAVATLAPDEAWPAFLDTLASRGRAGVRLDARVPLPAGGVAAEFSGRFVAIVRPAAVTVGQAPPETAA